MRTNKEKIDALNKCAKEICAITETVVVHKKSDNSISFVELFNSGITIITRSTAEIMLKATEENKLSGYFNVVTHNGKVRVAFTIFLTFQNEKGA